MANQSALGVQLGNKFSPWVRGLSMAAVMGAIGSVVGALGIFGTATSLAHPETISQASPPMLLATVAGLFLYGVGLVWFTVSLMMFGWRSAQFVRDRGAFLKWSPAWGIWGWFVPILTLFVPYMVLRDVILGSESKDVAAHRRSLLWFWIWWQVISALINVAMEYITADDQSHAFTGWSLFASVMAFQLVPFMMGRSLFVKVVQDLKALLVLKPESGDAN
jgi:hypothetical protein